MNNFERIIPHLKNGQIVGVHGKTFGAFFTRLAQTVGGFDDYASITHCGILRELDGVMYVFEMGGQHNICRPFSQYKDQLFDLFECPVDELELVKNLDEAMKIPIVYGVFDLIRIGISIATHRFIKTGGDSPDNLVCSTFVAWLLQKSGWKPLGGFPTMPSPAQLCKNLTLI